MKRFVTVADAAEMAELLEVKSPRLKAVEESLQVVAGFRGVTSALADMAGDASSRPRPARMAR